jgi:hypothetical protein
MKNNLRTMLLFAACAWMSSLFAMERGQYTIETPAAICESMCRTGGCSFEPIIKGLKKRLGFMPSYGIIVVRLDVGTSFKLCSRPFSLSLRHELLITLDAQDREQNIQREKLERRRNGASDSTNSEHPQKWSCGHLEKLNLKSLERAPKKSVLFCALPQDAQHLPLITAHAVLGGNMQWLIVQELWAKNATDSESPRLFNSSDDIPFITMSISDPVIDDEQEKENNEK